MIRKSPIDEHIFQRGLSSAGYDPLASENASNQDRIWFELNPHRKHRLRKMIAGEFPHSPLGSIHPPNVIIVRQLEPGSRQRFPVSIHAVIKFGNRQISYSMSGPESEEDIRQLLNNLIGDGCDDG